MGLLGCDQGVKTNELYNVGSAIHLVGSNGGSQSPLAAGEPIELAFDRLLLPISVTRQSFTLVDEADKATGIIFTIAYDPVARVVTITPLNALTPNHSYTVSVISPTDPSDPSGLHAIDGATMDPNMMLPRTATFAVCQPGTAGCPPAPLMCGPIMGPCVDFCTTIVPIIVGNCAAGFCHGTTGPPAAGLELDDGATMNTAGAVRATAIGRISVESAMGALSTQSGLPTTHFPQDMPIIDAVSTLDAPASTGDPGNSYLMYKVLMSAPMRPPTGNVHAVPWMPISDAERAALVNLVPGKEMPISGLASPTPPPAGLPVDSLERLSLWIAQGAILAPCGK